MTVTQSDCNAIKAREGFDERDHLEKNLDYFVLKNTFFLVISSNGMNLKSENRMRIPIFAQTVDHNIPHAF